MNSTFKPCDNLQVIFFFGAVVSALQYFAATNYVHLSCILASDSLLGGLSKGHWIVLSGKANIRGLIHQNFAYQGINKFAVTEVICTSLDCI